MPEPKKKKSIKFISVELSSPSQHPTSLWASEVSNEARTFSGYFDRHEQKSCMDAFEALMSWAYEDSDKESTDVEFVVWKKDFLVNMLTCYEAEGFVHDWLDFISYYAGMTGLSYNEASCELMRAEWGTNGVKRAQRLAKLFGSMLEIAKLRAINIANAVEINRMLTDIKTRSALGEDIWGV